MTIWILRFIPIAGSVPVDGYFKTAKAAKQARADSRDLTGESDVAWFIDDFGVEITIERRQYTCVVTNTESSAAIQKALNEANHDAARELGMAPTMVHGSSVQ